MTPEGIITSWNHGAEQLYGYRADEVLGKPVLVTVPPERTHETRSHLERLKRGESIESYQTERKRKDGSLVTILLSVSPLRDRKGNVVGASAIARDITAQLHAEQALQRNEKLATAGRLTAAIAHEINNPLEALTNLLYLARKDSSRADQHLEMAEREVQRIADIAQQTLGFVREVSEPRALNVSSTLDEVVQLYSTKLMNKRIEVQKEFRNGCEISRLRGRTSAALCESDRQCGRCHARRRPAAFAGGRGSRIFRRQPAGRADCLSPITVPALPRRTGPSYSSPSTPPKKISGTGLGLWLSQGIVRKHRGKIQVRSCAQPGRSGTVSPCFFPNAPDRLLPSRTAAASSSKANSKSFKSLFLNNLAVDCPEGQ